MCPSLYPERSRALSGCACGVVNATLTDVAIRAWIKAGERFERCTDGDGLPLSWRPDRTAPHWRLRDRFAGKSRVMNLGSYTDLPLEAARQSAYELLANIALAHYVAGEKQERKSTALARIKAARTVTTVGQLADEYFEWSVQNELTVQLLLLLAVRKGELIAASRDEFELEADPPVWHLPSIRTKTDQPLDIPLPSMAVEWLQTLKELACNAAYVLPARKLQTRMVPHVCESTLGVAMGKVKHGLSHFTVHDFRRTAHTHLAALGVEPRVAERCLNHKLRARAQAPEGRLWLASAWARYTRPGKVVEGVYNRQDYFEERRRALEAWGHLLLKLERQQPPTKQSAATRHQAPTAEEA
jgi:integrase